MAKAIYTRCPSRRDTRRSHVHRSPPRPLASGIYYAPRTLNALVALPDETLDPVRALSFQNARSLAHSLTRCARRDDLIFANLHNAVRARIVRAAPSPRLIIIMNPRSVKYFPVILSGRCTIRENKHRRICRCRTERIIKYR